jgi:hypothetical protein
MNYVIREKFGPGSDNWREYAAWAGLQDCEAYYSLDNGMRKSLFVPESPEDWKNCINADYQTNILTNLEYAKKIINKYPNAEIIGLIENPRSDKITPSPGHLLLGYDIIDAFCGVSLVTNWGNGNDEIKYYKCNKFALLDDLNTARRFKKILLEKYPKDDHVANCEVWAVYKVLD